MTKSVNGSKTKQPIGYDRMIYGKVAEATVFTDRHITRQRTSPGAVRGALKRLKEIGWIVYVPSVNGHMTMAQYKIRISGEDLHND